MLQSDAVPLDRDQIDLGRISRILQILLQSSEVRYTPWRFDLPPSKLKYYLGKYGLFKFDIPAELDNLCLRDWEDSYWAL